MTSEIGPISSDQTYPTALVPHPFSPGRGVSYTLEITGETESTYLSAKLVPHALLPLLRSLILSYITTRGFQISRSTDWFVIDGSRVA